MELLLERKKKQCTFQEVSAQNSFRLLPKCDSRRQQSSCYSSEGICGPRCYNWPSSHSFIKQQVNVLKYGKIYGIWSLWSLWKSTPWQNQNQNKPSQTKNPRESKGQSGIEQVGAHIGSLTLKKYGPRGKHLGIMVVNGMEMWHFRAEKQ